MTPRALYFFAGFGTIAGILFGIDAAWVTSRALSDALVLAAAVFAFGALMALFGGRSR